MSTWADEGGHPDYLARLWEWQFSWISFVGGSAYLYPPIPFSALDQNNRPAPGVSSPIDDTAKSMLERHPREETADYVARIRRAVYVNKIARIVRARVASVFDGVEIERTAPAAWGAAAERRTFVPRMVRAGIERVADALGMSSGLRPLRPAGYLLDVDLAGHDRDAWMRQGAVLAQVFGHAFAVTEIPSVPEGVAVPDNAAAAEAMGQRPYSVWFSPLDVPDWQIDARGTFEWVMLRYVNARRPSPFTRVEQINGKPKPASLRYRIWYPDRWEDWTQEPVDGGGMWKYGEPTLAGSGPNPIGRVPVDVLYNLPPLGDTICGQSAILNAAYLNRDHFNARSWAMDQLAGQTFAQLAMPGSTADPKSKVELSTHRYIMYNPGMGGGAPQYFAPPTAPTELLLKFCEGVERQLDAVAGMSRGISEQSVAARSGEALVMESADKAAEFAMVSAQAQEFERRQLGTVALWTGEDPSGIEVTYGKPKDVGAGGDIYAYELEGGVVTINEARARKGLPPVEDGDLTLPAYRAKHPAIFAANTATQTGGSAEIILGLAPAAERPAA